MRHLSSVVRDTYVTIEKENLYENKSRHRIYYILQQACHTETAVGEFCLAKWLNAYIGQRLKTHPRSVYRNN